MPGAQRMAGPRVIEQLRAQPHRFGFFQAVRLLERWLARRATTAAAPRRRRLHAPSGSVDATRRDAVRERLRFVNHVSLDFPASELAGLRLAPDAAPDDGRPLATLTPTFMGLLGLGGSLPSSYTEQLLALEQRERDGGVRAFYDTLSHPALALFYEAWTKHRLHLQHERDGQRHFLPLLLALAGLGEPALRERLLASGGVADEALAFQTAALQRRRVGLEELAQLLSQFFAVPVQVQPFIGAWYALPAAQAGRLGRQGTRLGVDALLGERVWQRHLRVRLRIGPLPGPRYREFLPGGRAARALRDWLPLLCDPALEYELQPVLRRADVRGCRLGGASQQPAGLGWDCCLQTREASRDRDDLVYRLPDPPQARAPGEEANPSCPPTSRP